MNSGNRPQLPLASSGCSCCAPADAAKPAGILPATALQELPSAVVPADASAPTQRDFGVEGMTCGHCVQSVETAVSALPGVTSASVDLVPSGRSRLAVTGSASDADVRQAVAAAGYAVA
ncbi:copper chaperone [Pseudarthrobacter defluvii]|uniref:cation transporter n=1 Tax=Pseudarthrobacter defluvii TaxID=410837 RepID=UPI00277D6C3B|nr:cation transporter [Pseudarthrobacter defluvii]MDQ0767858.1 copper chaperone [Pseudarthrobacter defluvii]